MITNKVFNTNPILVHAPGDLDFSMHWKPVKQKLFQLTKSNFTNPKELSIVTWNSFNKLGPFEQSLNHFGYAYDVLTHKNWTTNRLKIVLINKYLEKVKTEYVLAADSSDVLLLSSLDSIIDKFLDLDCELLFNAEKRFWPFSQMKDIKTFEDSIGNYYLNAGLWIGKTKYCTDFFKKCLKIITLPIHPYSEQVCIKTIYKNCYPQVKIDSNCKIFQGLNLMTDKELEINTT